jgi:hypothetical protein
MKVWIDADACPMPVRDIVLRAAVRRKISTTFVANSPLALPQSAYIDFVHVEAGPDAADAFIADNSNAGDLVVTQDIPLAAILVPRGIVVISPRGDSYNPNNIADTLSRRNLMQELRDTGSITGGPRPFSDKLKNQFANLFDSALQKLSAQSNKSQSRD